MAGEESRWVYLGIFCFHAKVQDVPLQGSLEFWRQILQLKQFFNGRKCTVLFLDDRTADKHDLHIESIAHGVITLLRTSPEYGISRSF